MSQTHEVSLSGPYYVIRLNGRDRRRKLGLSHEVVGTIEDGGPGLICCTTSERFAEAIVSALNLVERI